MPNNVIYLDYHATTPVDPRVLEVMLPYFTECFGNAASIDHDYGHEAKQAVEKAREQIAVLINAQPEEIIFTSGATESDNIALFGVAEKYADKGDHIITCVTEHKAVLDCCKQLEKRGKRMTYLPVDQYGMVNLAALERAITPQTILISIMAANNEIGALAPLAEIGQIAAEHGVLFHTDAAQGVGHIPVDVQKMNVHLMSISAHKLYGPKGMGVLYRRKSNPRVNLAPIIYGGGHERGLRSGTLNVPGIVGLGAAAALAKREMPTESVRVMALRDKLWEELQAALPDIQLNGHPTERLPHNLSVALPGVENRSLVVQLKDVVAFSTGSACTTASVEPSHVIMALGFGEERAYQTLRFGLGRSTTSGQIEMVVKAVVASAMQLKKLTEM